MDLFFLGEEGLDMDDIQDCEQDGFWNNSEDDTSEESEGDVETCVKECHDIHDEQDGQCEVESGEESVGDVEES